MKVKNIREWVNSLPEEFDEYNMVYRKINKSEDDGNIYVFDMPIVSASVDEENKEMCVSDDDTTKLIHELQDNN
jgi:hypothetical protein